MRSGLNSDKKGFTIIELLIAMMISSLIMADAFFFVLTIMRTRERSLSLSNNFQEIMSSFSLMEREIRAAETISPSSTDKKLLLLFGSDTITYEFLSGKLKRSKNSSGQYITTDGTIDKTVFSYVSGSNVLIEMTPGKTRIPVTLEVCCRKAL